MISLRLAIFGQIHQVQQFYSLFTTVRSTASPVVWFSKCRNSRTSCFNEKKVSQSRTGIDSWLPCGLTDLLQNQYDNTLHIPRSAVLLVNVLPTSSLYFGKNKDIFDLQCSLLDGACRFWKLYLDTLQRHYEFNSAKNIEQRKCRCKLYVV